MNKTVAEEMLAIHNIQRIAKDDPDVILAKIASLGTENEKLKRQLEFSKAREVKLCIDHNHATGEMRGLLCSRCNMFLGGMEDDTDLLKAAIGYLNGTLQLHKDGSEMSKEVFGGEQGNLRGHGRDCTGTPRPADSLRACL